MVADLSTEFGDYDGVPKVSGGKLRGWGCLGGAAHRKSGLGGVCGGMGSRGSDEQGCLGRPEQRRAWRASSSDMEE